MNIQSLTKLLREQARMRSDVAKRDELEAEYFSEGQFRGKSLTLQELEFVRQYGSRARFEEVRGVIDGARRSGSKVPPRVIPAEDVIRLCELGAKVFEGLPNVERAVVGAQRGEDIGKRLIGYEETRVSAGISIFSPLEGAQRPLETPSVVLVGDTHGTFEVLEKVFDAFGFPGADGPAFVFNGDYVDRGSSSVEVFCLLVSLKLAYPKRVFLTRGNHETQQICQSYSLLSECYLKYPTELRRVFQALTGCFRHLPIGAAIGKALCLHGGVNTASCWLEKCLDQTNRHREPGSFENLATSDPLADFLWADPEHGCEEAEFNEARQTSCIFGENGLTRFLKLQGYEMLFRSHTACKAGFERFFNGKCWTVFSVPRYVDDNLGAVVAFYGKEKDAQEDHLTGVIMQFDTSVESSMDAQLFCDEKLIQSFSEMEAGRVQEIAKSPDQLKLLFVFLVSGCIEADIGAPRKCASLRAAGYEEIPLPEILQKGSGLQLLTQSIVEYLEENERDAMGLVGTFSTEAQSDAMILMGLESTLFDFGIVFPDGLFNPSIEAAALTKIVEKVRKSEEKEAQRRAMKKQKHKMGQAAKGTKGDKKGHQ